MILTVQEAKDFLRIDGNDNDEIIIDLIKAIPEYLKKTVGKSFEEETIINPLVKTVAKFILQLWYNPQDKDTERLKGTIDGLLIAISGDMK